MIWSLLAASTSPLQRARRSIILVEPETNANSASASLRGGGMAIENVANKFLEGGVPPGAMEFSRPVPAEDPGF